MASVPINDPVRLYRRLQPELDAAVAKVLASGRFIDGPFTERFAAQFAAWCDVAHCVLVGNGMEALELALRALEIGPGDEVITVANAGGFATGACRLVGATPVWVDVRPDTLGLDLDAVIAAVRDRTKLVIATHLYGIVVDVPGIRRALDRIGRGDVRILEDCAQAHGATLGGRRAGSLGDVAAFSFYPTKNLGAFGNAGAVVTDDPEIAQRVERLRFYGWSSKFRQERPFGRNGRADEMQCAVLTVKLAHVDAWNAERRRIIARYAATIAPPARIIGGDDPTSAAHLAVLCTPDRPVVVGAMARAGIGTAIHYPYLDCDQTSEAGLPGRRMSLRASERARHQILSLPCYPCLSDAEIEKVLETLAISQTV
jgi:dTDP-3-amino-2,3,6-trideoxy-4-keto-D-glucose/dTDP-3-amino-3,4,6-trideoxy-alpha-D-glucose/dTDP-2,6-dideoxy-D-kanosamine transaminase